MWAKHLKLFHDGLSLLTVKSQRKVCDVRSEGDQICGPIDFVRFLTIDCQEDSFARSLLVFYIGQA
jgi:hypothetical protein